MEKEEANQELKAMGINPEQKAQMTLRKNQVGDEIMEAWVAKANELLKIVNEA